VWEIEREGAEREGPGGGNAGVVEEPRRLVEEPMYSLILSLSY
jgi:hypothetical protein